MIKEKKKIVILGGGFGGLYTYKGLYKYFKSDEVDITIVNRNNYFLFTPLLHEVATGSIAHHQVVESIRQIIHKTNDKLHVADLISVDCKGQKVKTSTDELPYDVLVVALGATTNFFNAPGAEEHSLVLKDLHDAIKLRNVIIDSFEKASEMINEKDRKQELSFAIVGGGATGVEIITEIAEFINDTFIKYYHGLIKRSDISVSLINRDAEILMPFPTSLRKNALQVLIKKNINVMLNTSVKEVKSDSLVLGDDSIMNVNHVIWAAGVKPNTPIFTDSISTDKGGRIIVSESLQVPEYPNVFVIGDMASFIDKDGKPLPMLAQVAVREGLHTGSNIKRLFTNQKLLPFSFKSQGSLVSLGRWNAIANIKGIKLSGPIAWFLWRTIYLFKFLSGSKRIKIIVDWTINIFYHRDITKA